jgi:hypothetical protein
MYYLPKDLLKIVGVKKDTYNSWRNRNFIRNIARKSGVASKFTKTDIMRCLIMKELSLQGVSYPVGHIASGIIVQTLDWERKRATYVDIVNEVCVTRANETDSPALLYVHISRLRKRIENFDNKRSL